MTDQPVEQSHEAQAQPPESNGLGLAGFIVSLVGLLCSFGTLSPIGLVLSFVAMFRRPRGFAIAGFVLGLLGSLWILILLTLVGFSLVLAVIGGLFAGRGAIETAIDAFVLREAIVEHHRETGDYPAGLDELTGVRSEALTDRWGRSYRLELDAESGELRIISDGPDGIPDTDDDIVIDFSLR